MVFYQGDARAARCITATLQRFGETSGLFTNATKSVIFLGGVSTEEKELLLRVSGMSEGEFPVRYLGIPLHQRALHIEDYRSLLQKVNNRLSNWTTKIYLMLVVCY